MHEPFRSILLVAVFLVPGYIWHVVESLFVYHDQQIQWEKFALRLLVRSTFVCAFFADAMYRAWENLDSVHFGVVTLELFFLVPAIAGFVSGLIQQKQWLTTLLSRCGFKLFGLNWESTAWNVLFSEPLHNWVIVTLKNGSRIYGYIGEGSVVSSDDKDRDLYISHILRRTTEGHLEFAEETNGIYISSNEISTIEFIRETQTPCKKIK